MNDLWVYLEASPLLFLTLTLVAYIIGERLYQYSGCQAIVHPVLIAVAIIAAVLVFTDTPYKVYFDGAQFVHFLLGPATVALAIPLYRNLPLLLKHWHVLTIGLGLGSFIAVVTVLLPASLMGADEVTIATMAAKSITTPVAMAVTENLGGISSITAVLVILTGIAGAVIGPAILSVFKIHDPIARGVAMGVVAHGIGTARALQTSQQEGAFSALGMGINAAFSAIWLPLLWPWLF